MQICALSPLCLCSCASGCLGLRPRGRGTYPSKIQLFTLLLVVAIPVVPLLAWSNMPLLAPIISSSLPGTTPGPHKRIGYTYLRHKSLSPYTRPSPTFQSTKAPVFQNKEVGYAVFYPCDAGKSGWLSSGKGVGWFPDPIGGMTKGYAKFLGKNGLGWLCESSRPSTE